MIPVHTNQGYQRTVTPRQTAAEVAGKVLPRILNLWRTAVKRSHPITGEYWYASYFTPDERQLKEWEDRHPRDPVTGIRGPARIIQTEIAH